VSRDASRRSRRRAGGADAAGQGDRKGVKLARDLIAANRRTRAPFLDLGNCGLSNIPEEVAQLRWLTGLSLGIGWDREDDEFRKTENTGAINQITDLTPISDLIGLRYVSLHGIAVSNLDPLSALHDLRVLDISTSSVSDISALSGLVHLEKLRVWDTRLSDLAPLRDLDRLRMLSISKTHVSDLRPLTGHRALSILYAHSTPITDITPLGTISTLQTVMVAWSGVTDLSPLRRHISQGIPVDPEARAATAPGIYVVDCPLTVPPMEIVSQGNEAILNYFAERDADEIDHLYEAKLLILGEGGAGKTSLVRRLYQPHRPLPAENESTRGIEIHRHDFDLKNGRRFRLNVWDFGGQEIYHATHQFFLTHRSLYLLLDDTRKDHKNVSDEGFKYWLDLIDVLGGHSPVLIFQNEKGGRSKAIDLAGIKGHYDNVKERYGGNLEDPHAADTVREAIEFFAAHLSHVGEELPARWIAIRADVQARAAQTPYITQQDYFEIYRQHIDFDRTRALHLSRYLHDLGVFLHFQDDPLLTRTVILQNRWATEAVFRVLEDETVKAQSGRFTATDCERLWRDSEYAEMHPELLALMQRFELCYLLLDSTPPTWLAPQLLPPGKPAMLTDWARSDGSDLVLRYRYGFLPKGIISRLTVRMHHFVRDPDNAWTTGVLFERDDTLVLVELLPAGDEIELRARGPERKGLLTAIATNLDSLNASFPGLQDKIEKRIPCVCGTCRSLATPHFFDQKKLFKRAADHRMTVECPDSYEEVDVLVLLDGIQQTELRRSTRATIAETAPRTIRIFLASSAELRSDRDEFDRRVRRLNDRMVYKRGVYLEVVRWEHFLDAMSATRLQDEYNTAVRACDVFVSLFFTKTGKYTEEEFTAAFEQFTSTGRPFVYTYFKNAPINTGSLRRADVTSLLQFKTRLSDLGHFPTDYDNVDQLLGMFRDQLDELFDRGLL
jgi:internalin A